MLTAERVKQARADFSIIQIALEQNENRCSKKFEYNFNDGRYIVTINKSGGRFLQLKTPKLEEALTEYNNYQLKR